MGDPYGTGAKTRFGDGRRLRMPQMWTENPSSAWNPLSGREVPLVWYQNASGGLVPPSASEGKPSAETIVT